MISFLRKALTAMRHADEFWAHGLALHAAEGADQGRFRPIGVEEAPAAMPEDGFIPAQL